MKTVAGILFLSWIAILVGAAPEYADYYAAEYDEQGEVTAAPSPPTNPPGQAFQVSCDTDALTLLVNKADLSKDLVLHVPREKKSGNSCVELTQSSLTISYRVALTCPQVVSQSHVGSRIFLHHEALLVRKGAVVSRTHPYTTLYTIVLECERPDVDDGTIPRADYLVYEHRISSASSKNCKRTECPYAELCLSPDLVHGYYCICSDSNVCNLTCPDDFYGCERENSSQLLFPRLQCINNMWLCDKRFDCKLKDDETPCAEIWSEWSAWSKCSASCGKGDQTRKRKCDVSFTRDPDRCKIHRHALGCSRRCATNNQTDLELKSCKLQSCSVVTCDRHRMTVVIPREKSMTSTAIKRRMTIGGDPSCSPSHNDTHVIFVTLLNRCNTTSHVDEHTVTYRNEIMFKPSTDPASVIMRDIGHSYAVNCRFNRRRTVILRRKKQTSVNGTMELAALKFRNHNSEEWPPGENLVEHYASGDGEFDFKMDLYTDSTFANSYLRDEYPLTKKLREEIFIGVRFNTDDVELKLVAEKCQGTPDIRNRNDISYVFIENGCPVDDTVKFYDSGNEASTFSIQAFKFADASLPYVYFRCDVVVCDVGDEDPLCQRNCSSSSYNRRKRSVMDIPPSVDDERIRGHVIQGPIVIDDDFGELMESDIRSEESAVIHRRIINIKTDGFFEEENGLSNSVSLSHTTFIVIGAVVCVTLGAFAGVFLSFRIRRSNPPTHV